MLPRIAAVLALALTILLPLPHTVRATTCSGGLPKDMMERFQLLAGDAPVVVLAEITASADLPKEGVSPLLGVAKTATFEPVVVLKQELPLDELTIGPLRSSGSDCSGGPLMLPGERVLLFLWPELTYGVAAWRVGVFGDVVRFEGDAAEYAFAGSLDEPYTEPAGPSSEVIRIVSDVLGLDAETRAAARAFAGASPSASSAAAATPAATTAPAVTITPPDTGSAGLR